MKDGNENHYDFVGRSNETGLECKDESLTVQADLEDADINTIVARFHITGGMPQNPRVPVADDFTDIFDFQTAMNAVALAEEMFMEYPAELRARFQNNPQLFAEFCLDENNLDEMVKLGLAKPKVVDAPIVNGDNTPTPNPGG